MLPTHQVTLVSSHTSREKDRRVVSGSGTTTTTAVSHAASASTGRPVPPRLLQAAPREGSSAGCASSHAAGSSGPASSPSPSPPGAGPPAAAPGSAGTPGAAGPAAPGCSAAAPPAAGTPSRAPAAGWPWPPALAAAGRTCGASAAGPAGTAAAARGGWPAPPAASPGFGASPRPERGCLGKRGRGTGPPAAGEPACAPQCGYPERSRRPVRAEGKKSKGVRTVCTLGWYHLKSMTKLFSLNISVLVLSYLLRLTLALQIGLSAFP